MNRLKISLGIFVTLIVFCVVFGSTIKQVMADGGDVTWATSTNALPAAFNDATSVTVGNKIYIMGQSGDSGTIYTPYIGTIGTDGEVTWTTSVNSMPVSSDYPTSVAYANKIYYMGAWDGNTGDLKLLYIGTIGGGGDVTWATSSNPLPWDFSDSSSVIYGSTIYVMGGGECNQCHTNHVAIGTIGSDGDVTWATSTNVLPAPSGFATAVLYGNRIYLMGGSNSDDSNGFFDTVYIGTIGDNGDVTWAASANVLPLALNSATAVLYGNRIYLMDGLKSGSSWTDTNTVFIGTIGSNYDVTWVTSSSTIPQALDDANSAVYNGRIYFMGGESTNGNSDSVYIGSIEASAPSVTTDLPISVSSSGMTLNGEITATGGADAIQSGFTYGTVSDLSTVIATTTLGAKTGTTTFSQVLSGLTPNTTYYFQAYAVNSAGTSTGDILSTTTLSLPTTVSTPIISHSSSGGSVSVAQLAQLLAPSASTTAYLNSLGYHQSPSYVSTELRCPTGFTCTPSTSSGQAFTRNLQVGSVGSDVQALQQYLNIHGFTIAARGPGSPGDETTKFGPLTKSALMKFQKANGIAATGFFGPITRGKITSLGN